MKQLTGYLVLSTEHIIEALREYADFHKLTGNARITGIDLSGDGKTTARVGFSVGEPPPVGRDPRD